MSRRPGYYNQDNDYYSNNYYNDWNSPSGYSGYQDVAQWSGGSGGRGRTQGSISKQSAQKMEVVYIPSVFEVRQNDQCVTPRRGPGRPLGSKNKTTFEKVEALVNAPKTSPGTATKIKITTKKTIEIQQYSNKGNTSMKAIAKSTKKK